MSSLPDYSSLQDALLRIDAAMEASEAHGALCGMLCAQGSADITLWQQHVLGEQEAGNTLVGEAADMLQKMYLASISSLNDAGAEFGLLLLDDGEMLANRVHALAYWVQGFLFGLTAGGINNDSKLPEDSAELMHDFISISQAVFDDEEDEASEEDYMQLVEFVRVGVLLINEELQPVKQSRPVNTETLH